VNLEEINTLALFERKTARWSPTRRRGGRRRRRRKLVNKNVQEDKDLYNQQTFYNL
jgi:hypothetical protein